MIIEDCYGNELKPGDIVLTTAAYGSDARGWRENKIESGLIRCTVLHMSTTGSGRLILSSLRNGWRLQRWPAQLAKYE